MLNTIIKADYIHCNNLKHLLRSFRHIHQSNQLHLIKLRDYQQDAVDAIHQAISQNIKRPAVVLATGGGKTIVFSYIISQIKPSMPDRGNKLLVLAHKEELVQQAINSIQFANPSLKVEIDMRKLKPSKDADVIVASVPTIIRKSRLQKYNPREFKAIIIDECHHATADSWLKILKYFEADTPQSEIYVLGFTATMERSDGKSLGQIFDKIVYERGLLQMVENGELVDMKFSTIEADIDLSSVPTKNNDYEIDELSTVMNDSKINCLLALAYIELRKKFNFKSSLVFCVDIKHCKTLCGVLQKQGINAQYVTGDTSKHERRSIIEDFKNGSIDVLCNVQVFTEGTDIPNVDSIFLARPTKSRPLLVQMLGRGLRLHKGKSYCHVVDIVGTRGTGIQSVPTLFSLPSDYIIEGKDYRQLMKEIEDYDLEMNENLRKKAIEEEIQRRENENQIHKKILELQSKEEKLLLSFETFDGFAALQANDDSSYLENKEVNRGFRISSLSWIRLEYDLWGCQIDANDFFLIKRCDECDKVFFRLTINRFTSYQQRIASNFKSKRYITKAEICFNSNLKQVIIQAEALNSNLKKKFHFSKFNKNSSVSDKQLNFLYNKLLKKVKTNYDSTDEEHEQLLEYLKNFDKIKASDMIFALKFSSSSLWVKWELQKMLGPERSSKIALEKIKKKRLKKLNMLNS